MIVVCTEYGFNYQSIADITVPVMEEYCLRHGYEFVHINLLGDGDKYQFMKHVSIGGILNKKDVTLIWYLDCDALITNLNYKIECFTDDQHSFYITKDFNELNGGSVIIRNTKYGKMLNNSILKHGREKYENEQNYYNNEKIIMNICGMKILPHPSINSYRYDLYPECKEYVGKPELGDWAEGQFVLHVPALPLDKRAEVLRNAKIIR